MDAWVVEALRVGYRIPFNRRPPLSERPLSLPAYSPQSIKGVALTQELQTLLRKGAVEPAPQSPGFPSVHQGSRLNPGASDPSSEGGSRTSPSVSGFLQPSIPRPEGFGVVAPHHRSVDPERVHHFVALPHGDSSVGPSVHPPGRLDDLPRPAGCLPAGSSSSRFASVSSLRGSGEVVSV